MGIPKARAGQSTETFSEDAEIWCISQTQAVSRMASRNLARKSNFFIHHLENIFLFYLVEIDPGVIGRIFSEPPLKVLGEARREQNLEKSISAKADASQLFATDFAARRGIRVTFPFSRLSRVLVALQ